jgi:hypothetical protein
MMFVFLCNAVAFVLESRLAGVDNKQFVMITYDDKIGQRASFTLPSLALQSNKPSDGLFCNRIFLLCTLLKYNYKVWLTDLMGLSMKNLVIITSKTEVLFVMKPQMH